MCFGESGGHREREKTRRRHACSVAERQVVVLGRESCPLAESYIDRAALEAGAEAEMAATRKEEKYVDLGTRYIF